MAIFRKNTLHVPTPPQPEVKPKTQFEVIEPRWLSIARHELGTREVTGPRANPRIVEYASVTSLKATSDEVPWCASFVCWCLERSGIRSTRSASAASFLNYGVKCDEPRLGCIVVFSRSGGNHVAFYVGATRGRNDCIDVIGGNQGDSVSVMAYAKARVLGYRWPAFKIPRT